MKFYKQIAFFVAIVLFAFVKPAQAHQANQSYVFLQVYENAVKGCIEMTSVDINKALDLGLPKDMDLEDAKPHLETIKSFVLSRLKFKSKAGAHRIIFEKDSIMPSGYGNYLKMDFLLENTETVPNEIDVDFNVLFDKDETHRSFVVVFYNWRDGVFNEEMNIALILQPGEQTGTVSLGEPGILKGFLAIIREGIWHIWIGLDHILFLVALILPSVMSRREDQAHLVLDNNTSERYLPKFVRPFAYAWKPLAQFKPSFVKVLTIISLFTLAHTITLSLAALQIVMLPSVFVESVIAISIALAAYHNIIPIFKNKEWIIAFGFGLFHGFGFASVLGDIGLKGEHITLSLLGFNLGVEIGQVAIICVIFPFLFLKRKSKFYAHALIYGSMFLILVSIYWFIERVFDVNLMVGDLLYYIFHDKIYLRIRLILGLGL